MVAAHIVVEALLEIRYKLRMMGVPIEETSNFLCDNEAVVFNTQFPSSNLKKKHNAVAYHKCRKAVAAGIVRFRHIRGINNIADILTKPKGPCDHFRLLSGVMFGREYFPPNNVTGHSQVLRGVVENYDDES